MNMVLIAVGAIILLSIILGIKKGFIMTLYGCVGLIVILIAVSVLTPYVKDALLNNTKLYDKLCEKCTEKLEEQYNKKKDNGITKEEEPKDEDEVLEKGEILIPSFTGKIAGAVLDVEGVRLTIFEKAGRKMAMWILCAMAYVITFVALCIVFGILSGVFKIVEKLPVIGTFNTLLGGVLGAVRGLAIVWILFLVMGMFLNTDTMMHITADIYRNEYLTFLYENNGVVLLLGLFLAKA